MWEEEVIQTEDGEVEALVYNGSVWIDKQLVLGMMELGQIDPDALDLLVDLLFLMLERARTRSLITG